MLTDNHNSVIYTGMTNNLIRRVYEHKKHRIPGFARRYNLSKLVYYEIAETAISAIFREKQIKKLYRKEKIKLITDMNTDWNDLYNELL
jgi:putative endonuclease